MNRKADPVEVEVAYVPTDEQEVEGGANPLMKLHQLLKGRYPWVVLFVVLGGILGGANAWRNEIPYFSSRGMIEIRPYIPPVLGGDTDLTGTLPMFANYFNSQLELIRSETVVHRAMEMPVWIENGGYRGEEAAVLFAKQLRVGAADRSNMVALSFNDADPARARAGVEAIIKAYTEYQQETQEDSGTRRVMLLVQRRDELTNHIQRLRDEIRAIAAEYGSETLVPIYSARMTQLTRLETMLQQARIALQSAEALAASDTGELTLQQMSSLDPQIGALLNQVTAAEMRLEQSRTRYGENHPTAAAARQDLAMLQGMVDSRVRRLQDGIEGPDGHMNIGGGALDELRIEVARLTEQHEQVKSELAVVGRQNLRIQELQSELSLATRDLGVTRDRLERINVESTVSGRVEIVSLGNRPLEPANLAQRNRKTAVGAFGGMVIGFMIMVGFSMLNRKYRYSLDASTGFGNISLLGILPTLPDQLDDPEQSATAAHCVHNIRTLLQVVPGGTERQIYCVTSAASGTGKTSLALALSVSYASSDIRTLLIDFDLFGGNLTKRVNTITRRKIGRILAEKHHLDEDQINAGLEHARATGMRIGEALVDMKLLTTEQVSEAITLQENSQVGLLDALAGEPLDQCIGNVGIKNLSMLGTGGATPKHAGQLSPRMVRRVIDEAREKFDIVIIDTGPVPGSIEASMVASQVDGVIFTVSRGEQRSMAERSIRHLESIGAQMAGLVFNRANESDFETSSYSVRSRMDHDPSRRLATAMGERDTERANRFGPIAGAVASYLPKSKNGTNGSHTTGAGKSS